MYCPDEAISLIEPRRFAGTPIQVSEVGSIEMVETTFLPSYRERLLAEWSLLLRSPVGLVAVLAFPAAGIGLSAMLLSHPETATTGGWLAVLLAFAFSPALFFFNTYRAHRACVANGPFTYVFDSEGVHISARFAKSSQQWPAIVRVRVSNRMLFVHFSRRCAYFVPERAMPDPREFRAVEQLARAGGVPKVGH